MLSTLSNPLSTTQSNNRIIAAPPRRRLHLVFDVETTGLIPKSYVNISELPHILQLSFALYDMDTRSVIRSYNSYIKVADSVEISEFVKNLTGVTREKCDAGHDIIEVLVQFYEAYILCDCLVAHNMEFDTSLIKIELERNKERFLATAPYCLSLFNTNNEHVRRLERYCTMIKGTALCNIMDNGRRTPKWPRLVELYSKLFDGQVPDGLHDSMVDTMACLKCYLKLRHNIDV